jgi:hypothetical protein
MLSTTTIPVSAPNANEPTEVELKLKAAGADMLVAIRRLRKITSHFKATTSAIGEIPAVKDQIKTAGLSNQWTDLLMVIAQTQGMLERRWTQGLNPSETDPSKTATYRMARAVAWDCHHRTKEYVVKSDDAVLAAMNSDKHFDPFIIFEAQVGNKLSTFETETREGRKIFSSRYMDRQCKAGATNYMYPGLNVHFECENQAAFYVSYFPVGAVLNIVKKLVQGEFISPVRGANYIAFLTYAYYEIIMATYAYFDAYNVYRTVLGESRNGSFKCLEAEFGKLADGTSVSWLKVIEFLHKHAMDSCVSYVSSYEGPDATAFLGSDASAMVSDPSKIGEMLGSIVGVPGLSLDTLKGIPGVDKILGAIQGMSGSS